MLKYKYTEAAINVQANIIKDLKPFQKMDFRIIKS